ncbi:hypothetical protein ACQPUZ_00670 [Clostridium tertium]
MISNYLYLFSIGIALITIIFIIYNCILLIKKVKASNIEKNSIKKYKNNLIIFILVLVGCISFIFYYSQPISIYKTVGIGEDINYEDINVYGNITSSDIIKLDSEKGKEVFDLLENYNYKRVFNFNDISGDVEFILFENTGGKPGIIEVWSNGYIRIPNNNLYKIDLENKTQLYSELKSIFMD